VKQILERRKKFRETLQVDFLDRKCVGEDFDIFVDDMAALLPKDIPREVVYDSLRYLAGVKLALTVLDELCWRMAGNVHRLKRRRTIGPWNKQQIEEWVPAQVITARRARSPRGKPGWSFGLQVMGGTPTGRVIQQFWPGRFCGLMSKHFGFSRWAPSERSAQLPTRLYKHPTEFVTLRLLILVVPELSRAEPGFEKVEMVPAIKKWNHEQMDHRDRLKKGFFCPKKLPHTFKCFQCPVGYRTCRAGTHRADYVIAHCHVCGTERAPYDDELNAEMCINCNDRKVLQRT
jgi:hypothetical protein